MLQIYMLRYILLFFITIAIFSAILMVLFKNPIYTIFSFLISVISSIVVLLICKVEFLAYTFLIVYVGAISILFLFVIMMINIKIGNNKPTDFSSWEFYWLVLLIPKFIYMSNIFIDYYLSLGLVDKRLVDFKYSFLYNYNLNYQNDIGIFSSFLYTHYFFLFILSGIILFVAMVGALVITTNKNLVKK